MMIATLYGTERTVFLIMPIMTSARHGIQSTHLITLGWHLDLHQYLAPVELMVATLLVVEMLTMMVSVLEEGLAVEEMPGISPGLK